MSNRLGFIQDYMSSLSSLLTELPADAIAQSLEVMESAFDRGAQVFIAGNGGSASTASHLQNDLMLGVAKSGHGGFRALALVNGVATITAIANDDGYEHIFSKQLATLAHKGDLLIVISGSGNSPNIIKVLQEAQERGLTTIGWLGMDGGKAAELCDVSIVVPSQDYGMIENLHLFLDHLAMSYFSRWVTQRGS